MQPFAGLDCERRSRLLHRSPAVPAPSCENRIVRPRRTGPGPSCQHPADGDMLRPMPTSDTRCRPSTEPASGALKGADRLRAVCGAELAALSGWAASLTSDLGLRRQGESANPDAYELNARADADWARSGAMWLTGRADGPPVLAPAAFASATAAAVGALATVCTDPRGREALRSLDAGSLLGERAAALGLSRAGSTSAGGHCRIDRKSVV